MPSPPAAAFGLLLCLVALPASATTWYAVERHFPAANCTGPQPADNAYKIDACTNGNYYTKSDALSPWVSFGVFPELPPSGCPQLHPSGPAYLPTVGNVCGYAGPDPQTNQDSYQILEINGSDTIGVRFGCTSSTCEASTCTTVSSLQVGQCKVLVWNGAGYYIQLGYVHYARTFRRSSGWTGPGCTGGTPHHEWVARDVCVPSELDRPVGSLWLLETRP